MTPRERRQRTLDQLAGERLDVLVIGGGIVGAGIARDAAMRGLKIGLVEQSDFASGTSSRSSRLLHGGLRYLAQGRIGLVREASREKTVIRRIAPHLVRPLPFVFPAYRGNRDWVLWQLKIGVKLYDLLCGGRNLDRSAWLTPREAMDRAPGLVSEGLNGAVRYFDGFTHDARLTLDTLRSAGRNGAHLANYCRFRDAERTDGAWISEVEDRESDCTLTVRARTIVNATGPWADRLPHSRVRLRVTKGVHLVVDHARLPVPETVVMTEGKRILFAIPWDERTLLGTTDTDYDGPPEQVAVDAADIRYVLDIVNRSFPDARLAPADVIGSWAGLRPLVADARGNPSDISRSHEIRMAEPDWWDVTGGKLTTYRLMAEQTVDRIVRRFRTGAARGPDLNACRTATEPLLPPDETDGATGVLPPPFDRRVVDHACAREWAVHLDDVMIRRTDWHYCHRNAMEMARQVAGWMGECLEWTADARDAELRRYREILRPPGTAAAPPRPGGSAGCSTTSDHCGTRTPPGSSSSRRPWPARSPPSP